MCICMYNKVLILCCLSEFVLMSHLESRRKECIYYMHVCISKQLAKVRKSSDNKGQYKLHSREKVIFERTYTRSVLCKRLSCFTCTSRVSSKLKWRIKRIIVSVVAQSRIKMTKKRWIFHRMQLASSAIKEKKTQIL